MNTLNEIKNAPKTNPTPALKKVDIERDERHQGCEKVMAPDYSAVVYFFDSHGPCICAYKGRAKKPAFRIRYKTEERRNEVAVKFLADNMKRKKEKKQITRALEVGDILKSSWGYEQTNIDYYLVTNLVGKSSVELVQIGKISEEDEEAFMQGVCIPNPESIISQPFNKRVDNESVSINSHISASKKHPKIVAGAKIYKADRWTAYA